MDVLFISAGNANKIYQELAINYSAIEPPTWALLLAESCRSVGFKVGILDANAEELSHERVCRRIVCLNPRLLCFVVYGQNVNAGTVSMDGAVSLANAIKDFGITIPIAFLGSYMQALPYKVLEDEKSIDIIFLNEGIYALRNLLAQPKIDITKLDNVNGIGFRKNGVPFLTSPEKIVPQDRLDTDLPGYTWDLLPYKNQLMDLYRSPLWHANYNHKLRTPYATLYTSLGCPYSCPFCMINIINRDDNNPIGVASDYKKIRYWSKDFVIKQIDRLVSMGIYTIRITDEMFLLNPNHYIPICEELSKKNYASQLLMWAYSRIDTIAQNPEILKLLRKAGFRWLCPGIESGDRNVRWKNSKGKLENTDIKKIIELIHKADIEVFANYLFGLPDDNINSMQKTLDLSMELCTSGWNAYPVMPLPGSQLYKDALDNNYQLPKDYAEYSFHSFDTTPMPTKFLSPTEVLRFRDEAFLKYYTYPPFLNRIKKIFGKIEADNIVKMTRIKLKRKILEI